MKGRLPVGTENPLPYSHQEVMAQLPLEVQEPHLHHGAIKFTIFCYKEEKKMISNILPSPPLCSRHCLVWCH